MNRMRISLTLRALILGSIAIALALLCLLYAMYFRYSVQEEFNQSQMRLSQIRGKNSHAQQQLETLNQFMPPFNALQERGFIGNHSRLQWLETLQQAGAKLELPLIDFTVENSQIADPTSDFYHHDQLVIEKTKMDLKYQLLHEGDWYNLLHFLHSSAQGLFSVEECTIRQDNRNIGTTNLKSLSGACTLEWYSLKDVTNSVVAQ